MSSMIDSDSSRGAGRDPSAGSAAADSATAKGRGLRFGVDWYPEQWPRNRWESDLDRMKDFGFSLVRIMEFAWILLEPEKGRYDFSILDETLGLMEARGLKAIIGTPTATFPAWLLEEGELRQTFPDGRIRDFGTRRMGCWNAPIYRKAAADLVRAMAERYGGDTRVAGWQIDNEIGHEGSDHCVCASCAKAWPAWLEARYGNIRTLNETWGTVFWGTNFSRFDQVPLPRRQVSSTFSPGLLLDYDRFMSDSAASFAKTQVELLRPRLHPEAFITTNLFPPPLSVAIDMEELTEGMDFASWDNYPIWGPQTEAYPPQFQAYAESYIRGLRAGKAFAVLEEMSGMQGHVSLGTLPPEQQLALWTVQAIARGADTIIYFRWRTAPYGQEQLCYGLHDTDDRETERGKALRAVIKRCMAELSDIASVPLESRAALLYSKDDLRVLREQHLSEGLRFDATPWMQAGCDIEAASWYAPFAVFNVNADVRSVKSLGQAPGGPGEGDELSRYKVLSLPLYQMADPAFVERLESWVEAGGSLILGYRAGARDTRNWNIDQPLPGLFSKLAGLRVSRFEALGKGEVGLAFKGISGLAPARGRIWADLIEPEGAEIIARYRDRRKHYSGLPAITRNSRGQGFVYYLGTSPDPLAIFLLYGRIFRDAGLEPRFLGPGAEIVERRRESGERVQLILNHSAKPRRLCGKRLGPWDWGLTALER